MFEGMLLCQHGLWNGIACMMKDVANFATLANAQTSTNEIKKILYQHLPPSLDHYGIVPGTGGWIDLFVWVICIETLDI